MPVPGLAPWFTRVAGHGVATVRLAGLRMVRGALDLAFPPRCCFCEAALDAGRSPAEPLLCRVCCDQLAPVERPACLRCGAAVPASVSAQHGCDHCRRRPLRFEATVALGSYEGHLREAALRMKLAFEEPLAMAVAELFWQRRQAQLADARADVVAAAPMHWTRRIRRGTNSPDHIAACLARGLGVPCLPRMLRRRRRTPPQGTHSRTERLANVRRAFQLRSGYDCRDARVLLVDDVFTTGATANECARTLLEAGAAAVVLAVVARAARLL